MAKAVESRDQEMRDRFGARLAALMRDRDLNHTKLAKASGVSRSLITRLINGERRVNGDQLARLSEALGVEPAALWSDIEPHGPKGQPLNPAARPGSERQKARGVDTAPPGRGQPVESEQGRIVGRLIDDYETEAERNAAMRACMDVLSPPSKLNAERRPGRVQRP